MPTQSYNSGNPIYDANASGNPNVVADYQYISTLLDNIPDNSANLIDAKDVRDAVWTLWNRIDDVVVGLSSSGINIGGSSSATFSADLTYDRERPSTQTSAVGGISTGSTFSGTIQDVLDRIFYPYQPPTCSLSGGGSRLYGSSTSVTLSFSINKNEKPITFISLTTLAGTTNFTPIPSVISQNNTTPASFTTTGSSTPSTQTTYATHSGEPPISYPNTYTLTISDGKSNASSSTTIVWMNNIYYGTLDLSTLAGNPNPDLSVRPDGSNSASVASSIIQIGNFVTDNVIKATSGTNNRPKASKNLATSRTLSLPGYAADGKYLFFAWPTSFGTPTFVINNLQNTAFTKIKNNTTFVNENGWSGTKYDVWISNTPYGTATINVT
jgi:hypothetical protein